MAHLWIHDEVQWENFSITGNIFDLAPAVLMRSGPEANAAARELWVLLASPEVQVRVNGEAAAGIRALADRDEIRMEQLTVYFSTERLACIVPFSEQQPVPCARCKLQIQPGDPAVS